MAIALDLYEPFDAGPGGNVTEDQWRKMARHWMETGILSSEDNELEMYADSSGLQVKVKTGKCFVRGHYGENTSEKILPVTANASGLTRIDRGLIRADFVNNRLELDVIAGTPGGAAPALTQSSALWEESLGQISIPNGDASIDAGQVTDERDLLWLFGSRRVPNRSYTPALKGGATAFTIGNGVRSGNWRRDGRRITGRARFTMGSTSVAPAGQLSIGLPVPTAPTVMTGGLSPIIGRLVIWDNSAATRYFRNLTVDAGVALVFYDEANAITTTNGAPITLAVNDILEVVFDYEAAA